MPFALVSNSLGTSQGDGTLLLVGVSNVRLIEVCKNTLSEHSTPGHLCQVKSYILQKRPDLRFQAGWQSRCDTGARSHSQRGRRMNLCQICGVWASHVPGHRSSECLRSFIGCACQQLRARQASVSVYSSQLTVSQHSPLPVALPC